MHKFKLGFLLYLAGALLSHPASAKVTITEVMPCNTYSYMDRDNYNFSGYIELSNTDSVDVNLKGYALEHYKDDAQQKLKWSWTIGTDFTLPAGGYNLLWADETKTKHHILHKLDADGGTLVLKNGDKGIDTLSYTIQTPGLSFGTYDGKKGYMEPSPLKANTKSFKTLARTKQTVFSETGGIKTEGFLLKLTCADQGSTIYYTTNGDIPTRKSHVYNDPIAVDSSLSVRAIAISEDKLPSPITTHSYIFPDSRHTDCGGFTIPIVNITVEEDFFYDDSIGIAVKGVNGVKGDKTCLNYAANFNRDWKRPVSIQYIEHGMQVVSQEVEASVAGGCTKVSKPKSLALKASKKTGAKSIPYHFFNSKPDLYHSTLHLRNGGQGNGNIIFRDGLGQTLAIGMNIDYQAFQPVAYYINGKYQTLMNLNERTNADYVEANYGLKDDEIDLVSICDVNGVQASKGDLVAYNKLTSFLKNSDQKSSNFFKEACRQMDMDEYIDYNCFEQFIANADWPGNNTKIWRERKEGSRFRWILYDTDWSLGMWEKDPSTVNMISWCMGTGPYSWANNVSWQTLIFKNLSKNPEFIKLFTTKYLIHLSSTFSEERINAVFDSILPIVEVEFCAASKKDAFEETKDMRTFALERAPNILIHLKEYSCSEGIASINLNSKEEGARFTINGIDVKDGFYGRYLTGFESEIKVYPPAGYTFAGWEMSDTSAFNTTNQTETGVCNLPGIWKGTLVKEGTLTALFEPEEEKPSTLIINEICASSNSESANPDEYGKFPDWIEVHNTGDQPVDLAGMSLSTNKKQLDMCTIPYGSDKTIVPAGGHLLLWAKGDATDGPLYLNFKLDVDKQKDIYLSDKEGNIVGQAYYKPHNTNESYGWEKDEQTDWMLFSYCEINDELTATPGEKNKGKCVPLFVEPIAGKSSNLRVYPNPAHSNVTAELTTDNGEEHSLRLFNSFGQMVLETKFSGKKTNVNMGTLPTGLYMLSVDNMTVKLLKE